MCQAPSTPEAAATASTAEFIMQAIPRLATSALSGDKAEWLLQELPVIQLEHDLSSALMRLNHILGICLCSLSQ